MIVDPRLFGCCGGVTATLLRDQRSCAPLFGGHCATTVRATAAGLDACVHSAEPFAVSCTFLTNLRAFGARMPMMWCVEQHEVRRYPADLRAGHHERHVPLLEMRGSHFQAIVHRRRNALTVAGKAIVDAGPHRVGVCMVHVTLLCPGRGSDRSSVWSFRPSIPWRRRQIAAL